MKEQRNEPDPIKEAKRFTRRFDIGFIALCLMIVPLILIGKNTNLSADWVVGLYFGLLAGVSALLPWRKMSANRTLVSEYERQQAQEMIAGVTHDAAPAADDPISSLVERIRTLASDDERILALVDTLTAQLERISTNVRALEAAVAAEHELTESADDPRTSRLIEVLQSRKSQQDKLVQALRDLNVELTIREDSDHEEMFAEVNDLLASLAAESEVEQVSAASEEKRRRQLQAQAAQRNPSGQR